MFFSHYRIVNGEVVPRTGEDAEQTAAENPGVETLLVCSQDVTGAWTEIQLTWDVREFSDQEAADEFTAQVTALLQTYPGVDWRPADEFSLDLGVRYVAHAGTRTLDDGRYQVGANLTFQAGRTVVGLSAFADYTGDAAGLEEAERNILIDTSYLRLSEGLGDLGSQLYAGAVEQESLAYRGILSSYVSPLPSAWLPSYVADPTLLRDFAATTAETALHVPELGGWVIDGGFTYLSSEAAERAQVWREGFLSDREFVQAHVNSFHLPSILGRERPQEYPRYDASLFFTQHQLSDEASAGEWFDAYKEEFAYPGAEEVTAPRIGVTFNLPTYSNRYRFQTEDGLEVDRVNTVVQAGRYLATGTFDIYDPDNPDNDFSLAGAEPGYRGGVVNSITRAYDDDAWAGEVGQEARRVLPYFLTVEGVDQFRYHYGILGGEGLPRVGVDPEQLAAENPGVQTALFGSFGLNTGLGAMNVYVDVRSFPDQAASDEYFGQLPDLFQKYRGPKWRLAGSYTESDVPHHEHAATWNPAEGVYLVGTHIAAQVGTIAFGIGAFVPFTGDAVAFAELDPRTEPSYERLRAGVSELVKGKIAQRDELIASTTYYLEGLGQHRLKVPEQWQ